MGVDPSQRKTIALIGGLPDSLITFRADLLRQFCAAGHRVVACASMSDPLAKTQIADPIAAIKALGAEYVDVPMNRTSVDPKGDLKSLAAMTKFLKELKPDIVIAYSQKAIIYGCIAARRAKVRRICPMITGLGYGLRDYEQGTWMAKIVRILFKTAFKGASVGIFQNNDDMSLFRKLGIVRPDQPTFIVNGSGIDIAKFTVAPIPDGETTFLLIGRLLKGKGVFEYVDAAKLLRERGHKCRIQLAGPLDEHPHALSQAQIDEFIATGLIEYLGTLKDVRPSIAACHVYVLPSYHEGTPRTVLEAMAMGRPIVTTQAPGCRETTVEGDNGFLVPVRESVPLADAMEKFIKDPSLIAKFGKRSREIAETKYDVHFVTRQVAEAAGIPLPPP